jgi:hypothetical protein
MDALLHAVHQIAAASLLGRYFPKDHEAFLALAGTLCRAGWEQERIVNFHWAIYTILWPGQAVDRHLGNIGVAVKYLRTERTQPLIDRLSGLV